MSRYAVIDAVTDEILNLIEWGGEPEWSQIGTRVVNADEHPEYEIGATLAGNGTYTPLPVDPSRTSSDPEPAP